jgi:hypothetical protein
MAYLAKHARRFCGDKFTPTRAGAEMTITNRFLGYARNDKKSAYYTCEQVLENKKSTAGKCGRTAASGASANFLDWLCCFVFNSAVG